MKKQTKNYLVNIVFFLTLLFEIVSGFVLWLIIPKGGGGGRYDSSEEVFIWNRNVWIDLHDWFAVALLIAFVIHLILHWKWIIFMTKKILKGEF
ncbi:MAG: DUF4405 domain-containing protein [Dehalococcoidales bacterium]|nr:DUF4405 domain-containing protein [Dehalococcoidales bacterium]